MLTTLKALRPSALAVFNHLTAGLDLGGHRKFDNASGTFMAVSVEHARDSARWTGASPCRRHREPCATRSEFESTTPSRLDPGSTIIIVLWTGRPTRTGSTGHAKASAP